MAGTSTAPPAMPHDPPDRQPPLPEPPVGHLRPPFEDLQPPNQRHPLDGRRREWTLVARHADDESAG
jgi:hypothetical protein